MRPVVRAVAVLLTTALSVGVTGCQDDIPKSASKKDFCSTGEKFSALEDVPFRDGRRAIDRLAEVGTPRDIDSSARAGFVELVRRMRDADSAADFRERTRSMTEAEFKHLRALNAYIQRTCAF